MSQKHREFSIIYKYFNNCHIMEMMSKINALLDKGYKMTNFSCTFCGSVTFSVPGTHNVSCPKCNKEYQPEIQEEDDKVEDQYEEFLQTYKQVTPKPGKSEEISKKIGSKLIQGWAMLQESCQGCNVPLMKNKGGDKICFGCEKNYAIKKQKPPVHKKQLSNSRGRSRSNSLSKQRPKSKGIVETSQKQGKKQTVEKQNSVKTRIGLKVMQFLQGRLDRAIEDNNLESVERILNMVTKAADLVHQ